MKKLSRGVRSAALLLLLALLAGCAKDTTAPAPTTEEQTGQQTDSLLPISGNAYTLIRPDNASDNVLEAFTLISNELSRMQGSRFPIANDFVPDDAEIPQTNPEILLGSTNRNASKEVIEALGPGEWAVVRKGNQIVIAGADDLALWNAAQAFLGCLVSDNGSISVPMALDARGTVTSLDNSAKIPPIRPDSETALLAASSDGEAYTPEWVNDLIIVEANLANATEEGTLEAAYRIIDHLAQLGVNGLWITPVGDRSNPQYFYGNLGLHTIDSRLTGTTDYEEGWQKFTDFVSYAHSKNIRVFMDVVTWGTSADSDLYQNHPDWYSGKDAWSGKEFDWNNQELWDWYLQTATDLILTTGIDGLRCDCEPEYAGYELFAQIRSNCLEAGRKIVIFSEHSNTRDGAFDFEQFGVFDYGTCSFSDQQERKLNWLMRDTSIISAIRNSDMIGDAQDEIQNQSAYYRYFTYCVSCHDFSGTAVNGSILVLAYQALFAPFIPIWYLGEEFGWDGSGGGSLLYAKVDWSDAKDLKNAAFLEQVKRLIAIRRDYADVFSVFAENHREANICTVKTEGLGDLAAYARYNDGRAVLIVPNTSGADATGTVTIPFSAMKLDASDTWQVINLLTNELVAQGTGRDISDFQATVADNALGVYAIERS